MFFFELIAVLQNYARKNKLPIDQIGFDFRFHKNTTSFDVSTTKDEVGISGVNCIKLAWNKDKLSLSDSDCLLFCSYIFAKRANTIYIFSNLKSGKVCALPAFFLIWFYVQGYFSKELAGIQKNLRWKNPSQEFNFLQLQRYSIIYFCFHCFFFCLFLAHAGVNILGKHVKKRNISAYNTASKIFAWHWTH